MIQIFKPEIWLSTETDNLLCREVICTKRKRHTIDLGHPCQKQQVTNGSVVLQSGVGQWM